MNSPSILLTVGHGTHTEDSFLELLCPQGVTALVDVRIAPGSRRFPQFGRDAMERWLPGNGISYRWERRLGGFRKLPPDSPDLALRNTSFRAYAGHMRTAEFSAAMSDLAAGSAAERTVIMCSESVWWRCHRRLVADHALLVEQLSVLHLMPAGTLAEHQPTAGVRVSGHELYYDRLGGTDPLPLDEGL